jgi:hypothetical protein
MHKDHPYATNPNNIDASVNPLSTAATSHPNMTSNHLLSPQYSSNLTRSSFGDAITSPSQLSSHTTTPVPFSPPHLPSIEKASDQLLSPFTEPSVSPLLSVARTHEKPHLSKHVPF